MRKVRPRVVWTVLLAAASLGACSAPRPREGPEPALSSEERALVAAVFLQGSDGLSETDLATIVRHLALHLGDDGTLVDEVCGQPLRPRIGFVDLDGDGTSEVVVDAGNTCTSGMAGTSVWLFVRDEEGVYRANLGFPGMIAEVRPTRSFGFPDLLVGGPGFCFGVWRWDGRAYAFLRTEAQAPGGCDNR